MDEKQAARTRTGPGVRSEGARMIRYAVVGLAAAALHTLTGWIALGAGVAPGLANAIGYAFGFVVSASGQALFTFAMKTGFARAGLRWLAVQLVLLAVSSWAVSAAVEAGLMAPRLAILCAVVFVAAIGYGLGRLWVFRA